MSNVSAAIGGVVLAVVAGFVTWILTDKGVGDAILSEASDAAAGQESASDPPSSDQDDTLPTPDTGGRDAPEFTDEFGFAARQPETGEITQEDIQEGRVPVTVHTFDPGGSGTPQRIVDNPDSITGGGGGPRVL